MWRVDVRGAPENTVKRDGVHSAEASLAHVHNFVERRAAVPNNLQANAFVDRFSTDFLHPPHCTGAK